MKTLILTLTFFALASPLAFAKKAKGDKEKTLDRIEAACKKNLDSGEEEEEEGKDTGAICECERRNFAALFSLDELLLVARVAEGESSAEKQLESHERTQELFMKVPGACYDDSSYNHKE